METAVGTSEGTALGTALGGAEGTTVGTTEGLALGTAEGTALGSADGAAVGAVLCGTLHTVWYPVTQGSVIIDRQQLAAPPGLESQSSLPQTPQEAAQHAVPSYTRSSTPDRQNSPT